MLKPDQHLYLFSKSSMRFSAYDMSLMAARQPLATFASEESEATLAKQARSRLELALIELDRQVQDLTARHRELQAAYAPQAKATSELEEHYCGSGADRSALLENMRSLPDQSSRREREYSLRCHTLTVNTPRTGMRI